MVMRYVRYRYDEKRGICLKTVEIVVEEWASIPSHFKDGDTVSVSVYFEEIELREQLRTLRARRMHRQNYGSCPID